MQIAQIPEKHTSLEKLPRRFPYSEKHLLVMLLSVSITNSLKSLYQQISQGICPKFESISHMKPQQKALLENKQYTVCFEKDQKLET